MDDITMKNPRLDWFNSHLSFSDTTNILRTCIKNGTVLAVNDGSYYSTKGLGACPWKISTSDGYEWVKGGGIIPGLCKDQHSYRAELGGQLGITNFIESVDIPQREYSIKTACDGLAALNKFGMKVEYIKSLSKHVDMVSMISEL